MFVVSHPSRKKKRKGWGTRNPAGIRQNCSYKYPTLTNSQRTRIGEGGAPRVCGFPPLRQKKLTRMGHGAFVVSHPFRKKKRKGWGTRSLAGWAVRLWRRLDKPARPRFLRR